MFTNDILLPYGITRNVSMALTIACSIPTASAKHIIGILNMYASHKMNRKLWKSGIQTPNAIQLKSNM